MIKGKKKSIPINKKLYERVKKLVKSRVKRWPSAYASGQLVRLYKKKGGKYRYTRFGNLKRWFKEKWINVCTGKPCGRKRSSPKKYPYCRPSRRVSRKTPTTSRELSRKEIKKRCRKKHQIKKRKLKLQ